MTGSRGGANFGLYEGDQLRSVEPYRHAPHRYTHWFHFRVVKGAEEQPAGTNGQHLGDFYGMLLAMEDYDVRFLDAHNLERGNLYKLKTGGNDGLSIQRYQAQGAVDDASDFTTIINQLRNTQPDSWLRDHVNWDSYYQLPSRRRCGAALRCLQRHHHQQRRAPEEPRLLLRTRTKRSRRPGKLNLMPWDSDTSWGPNWNGGWDWPKNRHG